MEVDRLSSYAGQHQEVIDSSTRTGTDGEGRAYGSGGGHTIACSVQGDDHKSQPHSELLMPRDGSSADLNSEPPAKESKHSALTDRAPHNAECSRLTLEEQAQRLKQAKGHSFLKDGPDGCKKSVKSGKVRPKLKGIESGVDGEMDLQFSGALATREENIKGLKAGLIHVAHKMPKNAHAHFVLGLMYQRLGQPAKAASAFQKAGEILKKAEEELGQNRGQLLAAVRCHYAVSMLQASIVGKVCLGSELQSSEIESWMNNLKVAVQTDPGHLLVWNTLGLVLLQTGQIQSAIPIFRSLLYMVPDCLDALANLGVAYLHSGHLADASRCLQLLLEKDTSHPGALLNYGTLLLCQYGSTFAGAGAGDGAYESQNVAAITAQQCLTAALKVDPKAGHLWANLAAAYTVLCDFCSARKCLEQASKLEPNRLSTRYAIAMHRVHDSQLSHDASEQLSWAANEMASILRESYSLTIQPVIAWAGLAMVNRAQHETVAAFEGDEVECRESKARAFHTLQQAIEENPNDAMQWHQLGLYTLCTLQFRLAQSYLKTAIAHRQSCGAAWSNLGIALQLSDDPSLAEEVYQKALSLVSQEQAHSIFSNLGNLYRQQKRFTDAHEAFKKALELCPNYAPACNNLGLLLIAEGKLDEAIRMFDRALLSDSLLDAAKSNKMKAEALAQIREHKHSFHLSSNGKLAASESSLDGCTHSESGNT